MPENVRILQRIIDAFPGASAVWESQIFHEFAAFTQVSNPKPALPPYYP
jgi:hypothetical protein